MARIRETKTVEETQLRQQLNRESMARTREIETEEETQLCLQSNREPTSRIRANESSEATILRCQHKRQQHRNRNEVIQQKNEHNITGNSLSNQCNAECNKKKYSTI